MIDLVTPERAIRARLIFGEGHYDEVISTVIAARCSVWIATANLKEMMIRGGAAGYRSVLEVFEELVQKSVELRILHATLPSRAFRESFDRRPSLVSGGLELRLCPRVHMKTVIVDGGLLYLGSANWTGAGLGVKAPDRRNFELGLVTGDPQLLDQVQALYDRIWRGKECAACRRRDLCEAPLDL